MMIGSSRNAYFGVKIDSGYPVTNETLEIQVDEIGQHQNGTAKFDVDPKIVKGTEIFNSACAAIL